MAFDPDKRTYFQPNIKRICPICGSHPVKWEYEADPSRMTIELPNNEYATGSIVFYVRGKCSSCPWESDMGPLREAVLRAIRENPE